ncbi:MAG: hypothetical protein ACXAEX_07230 [Promethearchaeota archaeon]|jgi:hypothetical protein
MVREKILKILLIVGIAVVVAAPILGYTLDKVDLLNRTPVLINEDSSTGLQKAFAFPVSVEKDQKVTIEFSVYYANVSATLKIFGKGYYDQQYALNSTPGGLSGQNFVYSQFVWGQNPSSYTFSTTSIAITNNGYWYIEFAGSTNGDYLISIPGNYVIVVYGTNSGPSAITAVRFNIIIRIDGPGDLLQRIFYYIGSGLIIGLVLLIGYEYYKKMRREL